MFDVFKELASIFNSQPSGVEGSLLEVRNLYLYGWGISVTVICAEMAFKKAAKAKLEQRKCKPIAHQPNNDIMPALQLSTSTLAVLPAIHFTYLSRAPPSHSPTHIIP